MIGKLKGAVEEIGEDRLVVDVGGVGYLVHCPGRILDRLGVPGAPVVLYVETVVREDSIRLYGFQNHAERQWFRDLMTVQGVGAKVALAVLGVLDVDALTRAVMLGDSATLARAPGVGKRVAERIAGELKATASRLAAGVHGVDAAAISTGADSARVAARGAQTDAISALRNLGYGANEAEAAVRKAEARAGADADTAALVRLSLKELAR